jgi:ketohexokinase
MPRGFALHATFDPAGRVLGVGIATLDVINEVASYPAEDDEVRASAQRRMRGGNVTNSLFVLSQLGHACRWVGTLGDDAAADLILEDLGRQRIDTRDAVRVPGGATPTSYVTLNRSNGSRTIIHFRDLPELDASAFDQVSLAGVVWVHFEGRNPLQTRRMIQRVRAEAPLVPVSVELEKRRDDIDALMEGPRVLLASRAFALASGFDQPAAFLEDLVQHTSAELCVVAWGAQGASYMRRGGVVRQVPGFAPDKVIDTLGAGDVFNAGIIHGLLSGLSPAEAVAVAVKLAGETCGLMGLRLPPGWLPPNPKPLGPPPSESSEGAPRS